jgi:hypothetical protein
MESTNAFAVTTATRLPLLKYEATLSRTCNGLESLKVLWLAFCTSDRSLPTRITSRAEGSDRLYARTHSTNRIRQALYPRAMREVQNTALSSTRTSCRCSVLMCRVSDLESLPFASLGSRLRPARHNQYQYLAINGIKSVISAVCSNIRTRLYRNLRIDGPRRRR